MSKIAARHNNFANLRAEYSERMRSNGHFEGYCATPELFPPLLAQLKTGMARIQELKAKQRTPEEEREMQNHIRITGDWKSKLTKASQMAFEAAFITVAQARLPKEHFLVISDEARALWRMLGFDEGYFPSPRAIKKALKGRRKTESAAQARQEARP